MREGEGVGGEGRGELQARALTSEEEHEAPRAPVYELLRQIWQARGTANALLHKNSRGDTPLHRLCQAWKGKWPVDILEHTDT